MKRLFFVFLLILVIGLQSSYAGETVRYNVFDAVIKNGQNLIEGEFVELENRVYISLESIADLTGLEIKKDGNIYRISNLNERSTEGEVYKLESDGSIFEGKRKNGQYLQGQLFYPDGRVYKGSFESNLPSGEGALMYANGDVYIGAFKFGQPHGQGQKIFRNGDNYLGAFRYGSITGYGRYRYDNNDVYKGYFYLGLYHGAGTFSEFKGGVRQGLWEFGAFKRYLTNEKMELYYFDE